MMSDSDYRIVTAQQWAVFFGELLRFGNVTKSAKAAGVNRMAVYRRRNQDPEFAKLFEEARRTGADGLEDEALRRAAEGYEEPVFYQGVQTDTVRKYSDNLMALLLKGAKPEKYRERMEMSGPNGGPIVISDDQLAAKLGALSYKLQQRVIEGECEDVTDQKLIESDDGSDLL